MNFNKYQMRHVLQWYRTTVTHKKQVNLFPKRAV